MPAGAACYFGARPTGNFRPIACHGDGEMTKTKDSGWTTETTSDDKDKAFWLEGSSAGTSSTLASKYDLYGGVIIDSEVVPRDAHIFRKMLASSVAEWSSLKKRGVWLQLPIESSALIPIATSEFGFEFHSAEKGHLMLTKWLPTDAPNTLPANASHTVGIGAVVTDPTGRVLLVREKSGPAARLNIWKLPTGLVDAGEELHAAAIREVKEETGVDVKFESLGAFTMNHGGNLAHASKSNLFFIVKCQATSSAISAQESEIAEAKWFTRQEWSAMPFPEKDSIWDALNQSALVGDVGMSAKQLAWGKARPDNLRWFYYPERRSAM